MDIVLPEEEISEEEWKKIKEIEEIRLGTNCGAKYSIIWILEYRKV